MKMKVYIAGPMRGLPDWNFPAFARAEKIWIEAGWQVFSPAQVSMALGYHHNTHSDKAEPGDIESDCHIRHVMQMDLACIISSDAIALLPGWEKSRGSTVELALAQFLNLTVYDAYTRDRLYPPMLPWACLSHRDELPLQFAPPVQSLDEFRPDAIGQRIIKRFCEE